MKPSLILFSLLTLGLLIWGFHQAMFDAPTEATMGEIQRIFYYHAPSGFTAFACFFVNLVASLAYLKTRNMRLDALALASAQVGVMFCTIVLITGPLWARPVWGIWWTWDARLTSTFVLWVLYVCYLLLRTLIDEPERRAVVSAVFGIFAAFDVPLVYFSIWFFRTQHPQPVIGAGGSLDPRMRDVLLLCWAATLGLLALLLRQRYRLEALRYEVECLRLESDRRGPGPQGFATVSNPGRSG